MVRLFKHYVPHAVLLLGLVDLVLLLLAAGFAAARLATGATPVLADAVRRDAIADLALDVRAVQWPTGAR